MELIQFFLDLLLHLDRHLAGLIQTYGAWTYLILFAIIFCETGLVVTPFLPGDSLLFVAGAFTATGALNLYSLWLVLTIAAIVGDTLNYFIGRYFGHQLFCRPHSRIFKREYLDKTHLFYEKHGGKMIIFARFVPIIRTFAPFVAGMGEMQYGKFIAYNIIGGVAWVTAFLYGGYLFGNVPLVKQNLTLVIFAIIFISILPGAVEYIKHRRNS